MKIIILLIIFSVKYGKPYKYEKDIESQIIYINDNQIKIAQFVIVESYDQNINEILSLNKTLNSQSFEFAPKL